MFENGRPIVRTAAMNDKNCLHVARCGFEIRRSDSRTAGALLIVTGQLRSAAITECSSIPIQGLSIYFDIMVQWQVFDGRLKPSCLIGGAVALTLAV